MMPYKALERAASRCGGQEEPEVDEFEAEP